VRGGRANAATIGVLWRWGDPSFDYRSCETSDIIFNAKAQRRKDARGNAKGLQKGTKRTKEGGNDRNEKVMLIVFG
jgi:hypothetical protein